MGTAIMLRVMPGEQFTIRADAYFDEEGEEQGTLEPNELAESLLTTLMGGHTYDGIPLEELPENLQIVEQTIGHPETASTLENIISTNYNPDYPKAHLNILFFDGETMELREDYSKVVRAKIDNYQNFKSKNNTDSSAYASVYIVDSFYVIPQASDIIGQKTD